MCHVLVKFSEPNSATLGIQLKLNGAERWQLLRVSAALDDTMFWSHHLCWVAHNRL